MKTTILAAAAALALLAAAPAFAANNGGHNGGGPGRGSNIEDQCDNILANPTGYAAADVRLCRTLK